MQSTLPLEKKAWLQFLPKISEVEGQTYKTRIWDIPYTIPQLSYLTHSHFRYYGKFPSSVAGQIIEDYYDQSTNRPILDNFCGSGTTLVESSIRGIPSFGVDVSWLSILATGAKTSFVDFRKVDQIRAEVEQNYTSKGTASFTDRVTKWFSQEAACGLRSISDTLIDIKMCPELQFVSCAYLAIVRRVSRAYDGEVRPHINKQKKPRDVLSAFNKKLSDMLVDQIDFQNVCSPDLETRALLGSATNLRNVYNGSPPSLIISHPPYLNAFNYAPVFSLEYIWGTPLEKKFVSETDFQKHEIKAHPASEKITENYFDLLRQSYEECAAIQKKGDKLAIVIGDCTRHGELIPVTTRIIDIVTQLGYDVFELNYRTTSYGTGKYAYSSRADYHTIESSKKDGILVFSRR